MQMNIPTTLLLSLIVFWQSLQSAFGFSLVAPDKSVTQLLQDHAGDIANLKAAAQQQLNRDDAMAEEPYCQDVFYLRYCLELKDSPSQLDLLKRNLAWREGPGRLICQKAVQAVKEATAGEGWNNEPVLAKAPFSETISMYIKPSNVLTTTSSQADLVYCIRAGSIDDNGLMKAVSVQQMTEFFLYAKEVNAIVANQRSAYLDKLLCVLTANDLSGVKLIGGSADFRKALSSSSKTATELYPATSGPTLLLNLPILLNALVKLFTPLFPPAVNARLKFAQGPLKDLNSLEEITPQGSGRVQFLRQMDDIVY
ncbi:predicted protein [Phaeodactylum tricornutum CCAP 1055/1]|jgi:hypothetical protein|uniref:CRAL-TRIO domain-containing protein n=1 Tax=Phaeodactylum tricornutum (strain CCAP 1055/1) TaxID=556484 RepID=B7G9Z5_PHATC|nr:predicted protein [Phaeodactylum tricornutum CCAP 1055/1]EEC44647.1 predicted protein [Phaeodactylum tricornutum CCAP 1055/1]|eukprot:XP_002183978.1 predicted protein [Phaeodactylum tricornutum CCAP 1055/1]